MGSGMDPPEAMLSAGGLATSISILGYAEIDWTSGTAWLIIVIGMANVGVGGAAIQRWNFQ